MTICSLTLQCLKLRIHTMAIIGITGSIMAASLISDWQAIPYDPCTEKSPFHHPNIVHNMTFVDTFPPSLFAAQGITKREVMVLTRQQTLIAIEECENATFRGHPCHWIPKSSILPSYYCKDCQPICRSPLRSLNFIQLLFGFILFYLISPMNITASAAILSDSASIHAQVWITQSTWDSQHQDHL